MPPCLYNEYYSIINQLPNYPKESFYFENSNIILKKKVMNCDFLSKSMDCAIFRIKLSNVQTNVSWDIKSSHIVQAWLLDVIKTRPAILDLNFPARVSTIIATLVFPGFHLIHRVEKQMLQAREGKIGEVGTYRRSGLCFCLFFISQMHPWEWGGINGMQI